VNVPAFLEKLTAAYPDHHLAPSLILSYVKDKGYYASIHTFPNGMQSRTIIAKASNASYEGVLEDIATIWLTMQEMSKI